MKKRLRMTVKTEKTRDVWQMSYKRQRVGEVKVCFISRALQSVAAPGPRTTGEGPGKEGEWKNRRKERKLKNGGKEGKTKRKIGLLYSSLLYCISMLSFIIFFHSRFQLVIPSHHHQSGAQVLGTDEESGENIRTAKMRWREKNWMIFSSLDCEAWHSWETMRSLVTFIRTSPVSLLSLKCQVSLTSEKNKKRPKSFPVALAISFFSISWEKMSWSVGMIRPVVNTSWERGSLRNMKSVFKRITFLISLKMSLLDCVVRRCARAQQKVGKLQSTSGWWPSTWGKACCNQQEYGFFFPYGWNTIEKKKAFS